MPYIVYKLWLNFEVNSCYRICTLGNEPVYEPFRNGDFGIVAVANLSPDVTEANLFETFSNANYVQTIKLCRDQLYRKSLGYG